MAEAQRPTPASGTDDDATRTFAAPDSVPETPPLPGEDAGSFPRIPGHEILRVLGRGGMGVVYLARQPALKRLVAVKMILSAAVGAAEQARFRAEAEAIARLRHPNIIQIHEIGAHEGRPYFTLEYSEGGSLAHHFGGEPQPPRQAAALVEVLARAVHYAHEQGVVHRDLKPSNVLRTADGAPKVSDFGLAKQLGDSSGQTHTGTVLGTPSYMAPEQAAGRAHDVGPAADVWALGAILYEALTGRPPFKGASVLDTLQQVQEQEPVPPARLQPKVPRDLETISLKCLQKAPARRYASAAGLADDLRRFLDGEPIRARPTPAWRRLGKWARRKPAAAGLIAAVAVALVAIAAIWARFTVQLREEGIRTREALARSQRTAAELGVDRSLGICARGDGSQGLLWLTRDLETLPENCADLEHAIRMNLGAWQHAFSPLAAVLPHQGPVVALAFAPAGSLVASASEDHTAALWDVADGRRLATLRHDGPVRALAFSADGAVLLTGSDDGTAALWAAPGGRRLAVLRHSGPVRAVAFHPREPLALTGSRDGTARLWRVDGSPAGGPFGHEGGVSAVAFRPGGKQLVTAGADHRARVWDVSTGEAVGKALPHGSAVTLLTFSPTGDLLATVEEADGIPHLWDARALAPRPLLPPRVQGYRKPTAFGLAWSPDGQTLATANLSWDGLIFTPRTPAVPAVYQLHQAEVRALAFSPDGQTFISCSADGTAVPRNYQGRQVAPALVHQGAVLTVTYSGDGSLAATGGADNVARLWRAPGARPIKVRVRRDDHRAGWRHYLYSRDGSTVFTAASNGIVKRWDAATGRQVGGPLQHPGEVGRLALHPGGKVLAASVGTAQVYLWDLTTDSPLRAVKLPSYAGDLAFSPDGSLLLLGVQDAVLVGDWETGELLGEPLAYPGAVCTIAISSDGRTVLAGGTDGTARFYDPATRQPRGEALRHHARVNAVAFTPDGRYAATCSNDKTARLWDVASGRPHALPLLHQGAVGELAFSADGRLLATSGREGNVYFWDVATGKPVGPLWPLGDFLGPVAFTPDGHSVAVLATHIRLLPAPVAVSGPAERLTLWAQLITGQELSPDGRVQPLDAASWRERRGQLGGLRPVDVGGPARPGFPPGPS